ncbi:MAG: hypothetical protein ACWGNI_00100 [Desulfobacterales bacterium]
MPKDYTATKLEEIKIMIRLQEFDGSNYYPASLKIIGIKKNGDWAVSEKSPKNGVEYLGSPQSTPYTKNELYDILDGYNNLNTLLANRVKQLYIDAINEDPSE